MRIINHLSDRMRRLLLYPVLLAVAAAFMEIFRWTISGVDIVDTGVLKILAPLTAAIFFYFAVNRQIAIHWENPFPQRLYPAATLSLFCLILPACVVAGRIIFSHLPPFFDPFIGCIFGVLAFAFFFWSIPAPRPPAPRPDRIRGARLVNLQEAAAMASKLPRAMPEPDISWAGLSLPSTAAELNFCAVGTKGSGKTLMMQGLMRSVLPAITLGRDRRALIYDVKTEWIGFLHAIGMENSIRIMNPLDTRCWGWDIANDMESLADADQFGKVLVLEKKEDRSPFFVEAAQSLIAGVVKTLMITAGPKDGKPARWTLRDLALIAGHPDRLRWVLLKKAKGTIIMDLVPQFLQAIETYYNIISSIALAVVPLQVTAGIWERLPSDRKISLRDWARHGNSILVMSQAPMYEKPLAALNRVMFKFISDVAISDPENHEHENRFWFFCDELKEAGNLDGLGKILNDGRSKGIRSVIAFQDMEGFRHEYGEKLANELPATCSHLSFLRTESSFTQKWAIETIGPVQVRRFVTNASTGTTGDGKTTTSRGDSEQIVIEDAVLTSELRQLPIAEDGYVHGFHLMPELRAVVADAVQYKFEDRIPSLNFSQRNDTIEQQLPAPWTRADAERLWPGEQFPDSLFEYKDNDGDEGVYGEPGPKAIVQKSKTRKPQKTPLNDLGRMDID